jgi:hypothetical protein
MDQKMRQLAKPEMPISHGLQLMMGLENLGRLKSRSVFLMYSTTLRGSRDILFINTWRNRFVMWTQGDYSSLWNIPYSRKHGHSIEKVKCIGNNWIHCGRGQVMVLSHQRQGDYSYNEEQRQSNNKSSLIYIDLWHWLVNHCVPRSEMGSLLNSWSM